MTGGLSEVMNWDFAVCCLLLTHPGTGKYDVMSVMAIKTYIRSRSRMV